MTPPADILLAFVDLTNTQQLIFWGIRGVVALIAAIVGWILAGPTFRILYRLAFHRPISGAVLPMLRLGAAVGLAALAFFFVNFGGGGGWGFGGGGGGGFGTGTGKGDGTETKSDSPDGKTIAKANGKKAREKIDIEILGGDRYPGDSKYYLFQRKDAPMDIDEVEAALAKKTTSLEVTIVITDDSAGQGLGVQSKLVELLNKNKIPHREQKDFKNP